jgi:hypothetical protein
MNTRYESIMNLNCQFQGRLTFGACTVYLMLDWTFSESVLTI